MPPPVPIASASPSLNLFRATREACGLTPESLSESTGIPHVRGHRQVADAHLVSVAAGRVGTAVATLDEGLAQEFPDLTMLVPDLRSGTSEHRRWLE